MPSRKCTGNRQEPRPRGSREARLVVASRTGCRRESRHGTELAIRRLHRCSWSVVPAEHSLPTSRLDLPWPSSWRRGRDYGATRWSQSKRLCVSTNMVAPPRLRGVLGLFHLASGPSCEGRQSHRDADNRNGRSGRCTSGRARSANRHASDLHRENHFACSLRLAIFFSSSHNFHTSSRASLSDPVFLVLDRWPIRSAPGGPQPATS